jgi:hypothetical protein
MGRLRVGTSVGHGEETRLGMELLEVLVGELLTVDGLATSALYHCKLRSRYCRHSKRTLPRVKSPP